MMVVGGGIFGDVLLVEMVVLVVFVLLGEVETLILELVQAD